MSLLDKIPGWNAASPRARWAARGAWTLAALLVLVAILPGGLVAPQEAREDPAGANTTAPEDRPADVSMRDGEAATNDTRASSDEDEIPDAATWQLLLSVRNELGENVLVNASVRLDGAPGVDRRGEACPRGAFTVAGGAVEDRTCSFAYAGEEEAQLHVFWSVTPDGEPQGMRTFDFPIEPSARQTLEIILLADGTFDVSCYQAGVGGC